MRNTFLEWEGVGDVAEDFVAVIFCVGEEDVGMCKGGGLVEGRRI
jgi:hypothetical protein